MRKLFVFCIVLFYLTPIFASDFPNIKSFKIESEVMSYHPENLYEYINGGADVYLSYGFQQLLSRDFSLNNLKFTVDIYDMGERINSFGIYKTERPKDNQGLNIGIEAVVSPPYQCLLLKDCSYVKVNVFEGEFTKESGKIVLHAIASALKGSEDFPDELKLLPERFKEKNSEGYNREAFLGLSILTRCVYAKYKIENKPIRYYVILPNKNETKHDIWKKLSKKWKETKVANHHVLFKKIPYKGLTGVIQTDDKIIGAADCENEKQMLKLLEEQLKKIN